jgi:hypothetical protein
MRSRTFLNIQNSFWILNTKRTKNSISKWANELNRQFSNKVRMARKYMKNCSISLALKGIRVKATPRFSLTPSRMAISKTTTTNAGEDAGKKECKLTPPPWKSY